MGGFDDHVAIMGDWVAPSPSPRAFFAGMLGDDIGARSIPETPTENNNWALFPGTEEQIVSRQADEKIVGQAGVAGDYTTKLSAFSEQKVSYRGGLRERMAARAGFNAPRLNTESIRTSDLSLNPDVRSPYLTIPPGISPTTLLESPVFLSNSLVQPSPTTGKFPFAPNGSRRSSTLTTEASDKSRDNFFEDANISSFAFKPIAESVPSLFLGAANKPPFPSIEVSVQAEKSQRVEPAKVHSQNGTPLHPRADFSRSSVEKDVGAITIMSEPEAFDVDGSAEHTPPIDEPQDEEADHRGSGDATVGSAPSEDGYNWRKYGQKQVKGSEYPRSYYKCTHPNCLVKKKVERSHEGHITEIIYKGAHNHAKPPPNRRSAIGSSNQLSDMQLEMPDQTGGQIGVDGDQMWTTMQKGTAAGAPDWRQDNIEVTSSASAGPEYGNCICLFAGSECVSLGYDGEGDESESKRRKIEAYATEMGGATRAIREPRVVVQTTSEVDVLDDGYRWRKYGQKVVKGSPNPRSYYKCTSAGCTVRKHVERASHDLKSVITTYEGKHNHDVPAARNSSHMNSSTGPSQAAGTGAAVQTHLHRPEPSQVHNSSMARFERPPALASYGLPGRQQLGPSNGFSFGMNPPGLANMAMAGLGPNQGKLPVLPMHPYMAQQRQMNEMGFMLPKGEPKMEPLSEPGLNLPNGSSVYHQIMSRLPLGPQM
ncbi:hypothetical protein F0562_009904 [Nyssa sinensis]|uniref:WRKY domain-containing protein n=1 Tax=Nyssa sinensis TaxID=561372 RepID=A0A5J5A229_9ASTE|nr:hypothetical protein F0562_009904 [Nyssa sinensis]